MKRQAPKARDLRPLLRFKKPTMSPKQRRLASALTIEDLRRIAKRREVSTIFPTAVRRRLAGRRRIVISSRLLLRTVIPLSNSDSCARRTIL